MGINPLGGAGLGDGSLGDDGEPLPLSRDNRDRLKGSLVVAVAERILRGADETRYPPPQMMALPSALDGIQGLYDFGNDD